MVLGISPFNRYFSLENITILSNWAAGYFKNFALFIPDEPTIYTLMALGYEEEKARKKAKAQCRYLKNKCLKALLSLNIPKSEAQEKIVDFQYLNKNPRYLQTLQFYEEKFTNDADFHQGCMETSKQVIQSHTQRIDHDMLEIAAKYLLAELPLYLNSPEILNEKESVFCYRDCTPFIQRIFEGKSTVGVLKNQGHIVVDVESNAAAGAFNS